MIRLEDNNELSNYSPNVQIRSRRFLNWNRGLKQIARLKWRGAPDKREHRLNCEEETSAQSHGTWRDQLTETASACFSLLELAIACCKALPWALTVMFVILVNHISDEEVGGSWRLSCLLFPYGA